MDQTEVDKLIGELEIAVDRLRSLYEQYFMGFEKLEPTVPRKELDRKIHLLRKEQIRNTALRFRFQMVIQRYNTYQTHWQRICREIENGTYKRHVYRAERRFASQRSPSTPPSEASEAPPAPMEAAQLSGPPRWADGPPPQPAPVQPGAQSLRPPAGEPRPLPASAGAAGAGPSARPPADDRRPLPPPVQPSVRPPPGMARPLPQAMQPASAPGRPSPDGSRPLPPPIRPAVGSVRPLLAPPRMGPEPVEAGGRSTRPALGVPRPVPRAVEAAAQPVSPPPRGARSLAAPIGIPAVPDRSPIQGGLTRDQAAELAELERDFAPAARTAGARSGPMAPKDSPHSPGMPKAAPVPDHRPSAESAAARASRPTLSNPHRPIPDVRITVPPPTPRLAHGPRPDLPLVPIPLGGGVQPALPPARSPQATLTGVGSPAPPRSSPHDIGSPVDPQQAPARPALVQPTSGHPKPAATPGPVSPPRPPTVALPRPPPAPGPPKQPAQPARPSGATASADLPDERVRQLYAQYIETKRRQNEPTAPVAYDDLSRSLRESSARLREKHGKAVDFEVAVKDGKTVLKPVLK